MNSNGVCPSSSSTVRLRVISLSVPTTAAAAIPTVVLKLEAVTLTVGIVAKPFTMRVASEPLLVTLVMPAIKDASTVVAVTALIERFSIDAVLTPP